jgi:hypothetical protein
MRAQHKEYIPQRSFLCTIQNGTSTKNSIHILQLASYKPNTNPGQSDKSSNTTVAPAIGDAKKKASG